MLVGTGMTKYSQLYEWRGVTGAIPGRTQRKADLGHLRARSRFGDAG